MLILPIFFGVALLGFSVLKNIEGLNIYHEARGAYEPNFLGFLVTCGAIYIALSLLRRFEIVGLAASPEENEEKLRSHP